MTSIVVKSMYVCVCLCDGLIDSCKSVLEHFKQMNVKKNQFVCLCLCTNVGTNGACMCAIKRERKTRRIKKNYMYAIVTFLLYVLYFMVLWCTHSFIVLLCRRQRRRHSNMYVFCAKSDHSFDSVQNKKRLILNSIFSLVLSLSSFLFLIYLLYFILPPPFNSMYLPSFSLSCTSISLVSYGVVAF